MILNSGETNVKNIPAFELGNSYSEFDIVYYSGYTDGGTEYPATQAVSGHYYYTGTTATSTTSNLPTTTDGPWTNKFFATPSYGAEVNYKTLYYEAKYGDGYYSLMGKSENSLRVSFSTSFNKRTDKETKAIIHLLEDSFNKGDKPSGGYTGIYWTPFAPYNKEHEFYVEEFERSYESPDVNSVSCIFQNESNSITDWQNFYIPFSETSGFWATSNNYNPHDIVYLSGSDYSVYSSGWYYYSGTSSSTSVDNNGPVGADTQWTKDIFYWKLNEGVEIQEAPRYLKSPTQNEFFIRQNDGLNKSLLNFSFTLMSRSDSEAKAILHFLEKHRGRDQFRFTPPAPYNEEKTFICTEWKHSIKFKNNNDISVVFREQPIDYTQDRITFLNLITVDPYLPR